MLAPVLDRDTLNMNPSVQNQAYPQHSHSLPHRRLLDAIPGLLIWLAFLFCVVCSVQNPQLLFSIVALLAIYTAIRFVIVGLAIVRGHRLIRRWEQRDWFAHYQANKTADSLPWDAVRHVIIIPNYREPMHILRRTLDHLGEQYEARKRLIVVLAMEEGEAESAEKGDLLKQEYAEHFAHIFYTIHPRGLPGEIPGKSSNIAWAARWIKKELVDHSGYHLGHLLVTSTDADITWHPQHLYALTALFALNPARYERIFQAAIRYHGNIWKINPLLRIINAYSSAFELGYLAATWWTLLPISSYSLSLKLLHDCDYWNADVMSDDWHIYVKSYFFMRGKLRVEPVYLPFLADAATGENFLEAAKSRYEQTLRHAWGSKEMGVVIGRWASQSGMPFFRTLRVLARISHDILLAGAGWVVLTVGSQLPLLMNPQLIPSSPEKLLENPPLLAISLCGAVIILLIIVFWYQDMRSRPPRPAPATLLERLLTLLSFPLLPVLTLIFVALPVIQAQTRMLLGMGLEYRVTKKL